MILIVTTHTQTNMLEKRCFVSAYVNERTVSTPRAFLGKETD